MKNLSIHSDDESAKTGNESMSTNQEVSGYGIESNTPVNEAVDGDSSADDTKGANEVAEKHHGKTGYSTREIESKPVNDDVHCNDDEGNSQTSNNDNEEVKNLLFEAGEKEADADDEKIKQKLTGVPIDRGWAWAVLAGCVLYIIFWGGVARSYGVFFLEFQKRFHAKAAEVAIMNIIQNITISITSLFTMTIVLKKFNCRTVVAIGGISNALSHIISGITQDIRVFYFSHGLFGGAGIAMVGPPMMSTIGIYFKKHRGLANSIYTASASVGGLILAPVFTTLFQEYGYTGTMLIVSGLILHSLVSAAFMRPPSWFTKRVTQRTEEKAVNDKLVENDIEYVIENHLDEAVDHSSAVEKYHQAPSNNVKNDTDIYIDSNHQMTNSSYTENCTFSKSDLTVNSQNTTAEVQELMEDKECKERDMYVSVEDLYGSFISIQTDNDAHEKTVTEKKRSSVSSAKTMVADIIKLFDFNLLKDAPVLLYLSMAFVLCSGMILTPIYLAPFAKDAGLTYDDIAIMLSMAASVDIVSKIVSGIVADRQWIRRSSMLAFAAFATGTMCHFARLCTDKPTILTLAVIAACFYGWYASMYATILIDTIGLEKFQSSLGFVSVIHGLSVAVFFPISGLLRDITGSYHQTLHLAGGLCYIGTVILVLLPVVQRKCKRKNNEKVVQ